MRSRRAWLAVVIAVLMTGPLVLRFPAQAQVPPPQKPATPPPSNPGAVAPSPENVAPTAPVITVQGVCEPPVAGTAEKAGECALIVTRAEFEKMANALDPNMAPPARQQLADSWAQILVVAGRAHKLGLDDDPKTKDIFRFIQMKTLADIYNQQLQRKAREVPAQTVDDYYNAHADKYDEATLRRIFIPKSAPGGGAKLSDAAFTALAEGLHKRAVAGEDFDKLQQAAFDALGIKGSPPGSIMTARRNGVLSPPQEQAVFNLKPGEVSPVITDNLASYIYKLESRRILPLDTVRLEILQGFAHDQYQAAIGDVFDGVKAQLNTEYFGPSAVINLPVKPPPRLETGTPPKAGTAPTLNPTPPQPK